MSSSVAKHSAGPQFVEVVLPLPIRRTFMYRAGGRSGESVPVGSRVTVPFGNRKLTGYVVDSFDELPAEPDLKDSSIKEIFSLLDEEPLITSEIFELTKWTADYYLASWGELLKASLPAGINARLDQRWQITELGRAELHNFADRAGHKYILLAELAKAGDVTRQELERRSGIRIPVKTLSDLANTGLIEKSEKQVAAHSRPKRRKAVRLLSSVGDGRSERPLTPRQQSTIDALKEHGGEMLFTDLIETANVGGSSVSTLAKRGMLEVFVQEIFRDPLAGEELPVVESLVLSAEQQTALNAIGKALEIGDFKSLLLHGVTGSGKTEVYFRAMRMALEQGRSSLMLVPEIALTPLFSRQLRSVFGSSVAILHSNLSAGERFDEWRRVRSGNAKIVIGTRSAVFAPLENLGLIIVDEEHDSSYRQQESPFYNARDVAVMRANLADAVVVLGSATPAMESFHNAKTGKYEYLRLQSRIADRPMASADVIDMREVFRLAGKDVTFSPRLLAAITETHSRGEQSIILLNRRGFSQFVLCRSCGESMKCPNCDITLTYHRKRNRLICHYCDHQAAVPDACPFCASEFLYFIGEGTEQLEDALIKRFPNLRIARIDRDTMHRRRDLERMLLKFDRGEIDMLVGTQMIAKGHDFPNVTLVGVVSVDIGLGLPDLRSAERTFQLLTQVAGRSGRGDRPGRVLIQTYYPDHYAIRHARAQDYEGFYSEEVRYRERFGYPPFSVLASILLRHGDLAKLQKSAQILKNALDAANEGRLARITGPAPASLARLKGEHRIQILIRAPGRKLLRALLEQALEHAKQNGCDMRSVFVEIDPVSIL